ncbi:MAG: DUF3352 domain-containing protein [Candidatus Sumerlaeota bacterium]|nr:DUF3352 domain-containing protein [Candidatus Sumerlaeota bacterium]
MQRIRQITLLCAAVVFFAAGARAQAPKPAAMLADSVLGIEAPDLGKTWTSFSATTLNASVQALLNSAATQNNPGWKDFQEKKAAFEQKLGFPISPKDVCGEIVKGLSLSVAPRGKTKEADWLLVFQLGNAEKFQKLFNAIREEAAADAGVALDTTTEKYKNAEIVTLGPGKGAAASAPAEGVAAESRPAQAKVAYAAVFGSSFAASNDKAILQQAIDGAGARLGMPEAASTAFKAMKGSNFDLTLFADYAALANSADADLSRVPKMFQGVKSLAAGASISPKEIDTEAVYVIDEKSDNLMAKSFNAKPEKLAALSIAPAGGWLTVALNNLNLQAMLDAVRAILAMAPDPNAVQNFNNGLAQADQQLGFSLEKDLIPALGSNMVFALNRMTINPLMPAASQVDLTLGLQMKDAAKVEQILGSVEKQIAAQAPPNLGAPGGMPGSAPASAPELFQSAEHQGATIRYAQIPGLQTLSPGYAIDGEYLILNATLDNIKAAIDRHHGAPSAANSPLLQTLAERSGQAEANSVMLVEFSSIVQYAKDMATPFLQMAAGQQGPEKMEAINLLFNALQSIKQCASTTRRDGGIIHSFGLVTMGA